MKKLLSFCLTFVMALTLLAGALPAEAASITETLKDANIINGDYEMGYLAMNGAIKKQSYTYYEFSSPTTGEKSEIPAYCVNPTEFGVPQTVTPGESIEYTVDRVMSDPKVIGILATGYPHNTLIQMNLDNKYQAFYATKMALWCYLIPSWSIDKLTVAPGLSGSELNVAERILTAAKKTYINGTQWTHIPQPTITTAPDKDRAYPVTIDGKEYVQQVFTLHSDTWAKDLSVKIMFSDPTLAQAVGAKIVDLNNKEISAVSLTASYEGVMGSFDGTYKIIVPAENAKDMTQALKVNLDATVYKYEMVYAICAEEDKYGTLQNYLLDTDPATTMAGNGVFTPPDETSAPPEEGPDTPGIPQTALKIVKMETGTNTPLSGAVFQVVAPDGTTLGSFSTGPSGSVTIPLNEIGNYTITEMVAPKYHLLPDSRTQHVKVAYGKVSTVTFENAPYGDLRIEKIDGASGDSIDGAQVQIKHIESGATYTGTTGPGGAVTFTQLTPGAYEIQELTAPTGWQKDPKTYTTNVVSGQCVTFTLKNAALPGLKIIKYDRVSHETMSGVSFQIYRDALLLGTYETDALGELTLLDLTPGTYRVEEVDTGDTGHIKDPTPQEVELKAGDGIKVLYFFNDRKPGLWLVKVDSADPSKVIPNAVFEIKSVDGNYGPREFTTDARGEIDLTELDPGAYVVTEKACPGYVIDSAQRIIQLRPNHDEQFVFTNSIRPSLSLIKLSAGGTPLPGVTFRIAKIEDGSHYLDRTTDAQGRILISDLDPGVYSVKETATVSDHIIDLREHHVELFPGRTSTIVLQNAKRPNLIVYKHDADTGAPVPDTVFQVRAADGHSVDEIKTDSTGRAALKNLLPGVYEITEKSVPAPYLLDAPSQLVTLYPNRDHSVYFENHKKPTLTVNKLDSVTGDSIQGAKFQVWYASNNTDTGELNDLGFFYSDENGQFTIDALRDGWYKITEVEPAHGYAIKDPATQEVYIKGGERKTVTFENVPLSALVVWKYDSVTGEAVKNAVFQVKYLSGTSGTGGTVIGTYKTSHNGSFTVTGLKEGTYIVEELASDSGHVIDTAPQTAYISGQEQDVVQLYFGNSPKGALLIKKIDSVTHKPLSDVEFMVITSDGTVVGNANGKYVTDSAGSILIDNIDPGTTLVVKETRAKDGYLLDDVPQTAKIKAGETVTLEFRNQPTSGLLIVKKDAVTGKPLSNVEFLVTDSAGGVIGSANGKYVTDAAGTIRIDGLTPGMTVIAKETRAKDGYLMDDTPQTIKIKANETVTLEFRNQPKGGLIVNKLSSTDKTPLAGVAFKITYADGKVVDAEGGKLSSNGLYYTDQQGQIILSGITGTLVVTEVESIPGYTISENTRTQTVVVNPNDTQSLIFYNDPVGGVELIKVNEAKRAQCIPNTTFEIRRVDDALVDTVTTDKNGRVFVTLEDGAYYAVEVQPAEGYRLDDTPHYFEVKDGKSVTLIVTNKAFTGILIHKIDSVTGKGIPDVTFLVYDGNKNPIDQVTTDQRGYAYVDDLGIEGKVYLRELEAEGYLVDEQLKTVYVRPGETTELTWENTPVTGQIQITKYAAEDNSVTGQAAGTALPGAVFEIVRHKSGVVVDYITTNARGVAVSDPLPLGRYIIREVTAPAYYQLSGEAFDIDLEFAGQIVRLSAYNKCAELGITITKTGVKEVLAGSSMTYHFKVANTSNVALENFFWHDRIPTDAATGMALVTGTYSQRLNYRVLYKTNYNDYRVLASNLLTTNNYSFALNALPLMGGEVVTDVYFDFGTVPAGFQSKSSPMLTVAVGAKVIDGYNVINRADAGGKYQGTWETANAGWVTIVRNLTPVIPLPKTGH